MRQESNERTREAAEHAGDDEGRVRATREGVVARLTQLALEVPDVRSLMQTTSEWVADALGVPLCAVLRPCPGDRELILVAGVGWREGLVGNGRVSAGRESHAGYTLLTDRPIVVKDPTVGTAFSAPSFVSEHGAVSGASVVIRCEERALGILTVYTTDPHAFAQCDIDFLQAVANVLALSLRWREEAAHATPVTAVMEASSDFVDMVSPNGSSRETNPEFRDALGGGPQDDVAQGRIEDHHSDWTVERIKSDGIPAATKQGVSFGETAIRRADGFESPVSPLIAAHRGTDREVEHLSMVMCYVLDRQRLERELAAKSRLLEAMANVHACSLPGFDLGALFDGLLTDLLGLSDSERGFIGDAVTKEDGTQVLETRAIARVARTGSPRAFGAREPATSAEFPYLIPLFDRVLTAREAVIINDAANDFDVGANAPGHGAPQRLLGLPLLHAGTLVGVVGLAHRPQGYDDALVTYLQPFVDVCAQLVSASRGPRQSEEPSPEPSGQDEHPGHAAGVATAGELASGIAHELVQPLTTIINYANGVLRTLDTSDRPDDDVRVFVTRIVHQAERAASIVKGISRLASGKPPQRVATNMGQVVRRAVELIKLDPRHHGVSVAIESEAAIPLLDIDPIQIEQVLVNLIRNAFDALELCSSGAGQIVIGIHRDGDSAVDVTVADSGPGVLESRIQHLFEPFVTTEEDGTGLGLAISRTIAEAHGGRLFVARERGGNTVFHLRLPLPGGEATVL